jgi:hypothetical protein
VNQSEPNSEPVEISALPLCHQAKPRHRHLRRWLKVILLLVIFASGMVTGGGLTVYAIAQRMRMNLADPQARAQTWANRVARRLNLNDSQKQAVQKVMLESSLRFEELRAEINPRIIIELDRMTDEVADVLPDDKAQVWREQFEHLRCNWLPAPPQDNSGSTNNDQSSRVSPDEDANPAR